MTLTSSPWVIELCVRGNMDFSLLSHESFIGKKVADLPTPALILSKPVLERNTQQVLDDVKELNIAFRPHVKTLKVRIISWTRA